MNKALIIIDFVNDFVATDGKLTCGKPGQAIDAEIARLTRQFAADGQLIVTANDYHEEDDAFHPENRLFPAHCLVNAPGRQMFGQTGVVVAQIPSAQYIHLDKTRYSAFAGTTLDIKLRERGINNIYLTGVCSDICVLHTAVDAYNLGYKLHIYEQGVASFNPEGHTFALSHFKNSLGAEVL